MAISDTTKDELLTFLDKIDAIADELENHPQSMVYYIGIVDQIRNSNTAACININNSWPHAKYGCLSLFFRIIFFYANRFF